MNIQNQSSPPTQSVFPNQVIFRENIKKTIYGFIDISHVVIHHYIAIKSGRIPEATSILQSMNERVNATQCQKQQSQMDTTN